VKQNKAFDEIRGVLACECSALTEALIKLALLDAGRIRTTALLSQKH